MPVNFEVSKKGAADMTRSPFLVAAFIVVAVATVTGALPGIAVAQTPPAKSTLWDGLYTDEQASRGNTVFSASCANCHSLESQEGRPLTGKIFWDHYTQKTVGDLFTFMQKNMPNGNPGSLSEKTYADLVAFVLKSNGVPAGTAELVPSAVAAIPIVPKDGPAELPAGALVRVVGCLAKDGADFVLKNATAPQRTDKTGAAPDDATRALGEKSITLKFLLTKLDSDIGKRMSATGLLIGAGGSGGLNVSTVNKVADSCP
jgi:mono/diheme cytochrome c family protein